LDQFQPVSNSKPFVFDWFNYF